MQLAAVIAVSLIGKMEIELLFSSGHLVGGGDRLAAAALGEVPVGVQDNGRRSQWCDQYAVAERKSMGKD